MRMLSFKAAIVFVSLLVSICVSAGELKWMDNFEKAKAVADKDEKYILADFSGSDWCGWCIKLDKEVFNTPEFKKYADENLVLFMADFPKSKEQPISTKDQNVRLMDEYQVLGFPTVLLLTSNGDVIFTTGYQEGGPKPYIESLKKSIDKYNVKKPSEEISKTSITPKASK